MSASLTKLTQSWIGSHVAELGVLLATLILGFAYLVDPSVAQRSPVGEQAGAFQAVWATLELMGGILGTVGLAARQVNIRVAGLSLAAFGLLMHAWAALIYSPSWDWRTLIYVIFALVCAVRGLAVGMTQLRIQTKREQRGLDGRGAA